MDRYPSPQHPRATSRWRGRGTGGIFCFLCFWGKSLCNPQPSHTKPRAIPSTPRAFFTHRASAPACPLLLPPHCPVNHTFMNQPELVLTVHTGNERHLQEKEELLWPLLLNIHLKMLALVLRHETELEMRANTGKEERDLLSSDAVIICTGSPEESAENS